MGLDFSPTKGGAYDAYELGTVRTNSAAYYYFCDHQKYPQMPA
jgi:hypothetical protein